ncbi:MAG: hypothetical protein OQL19_02630 [Gammaproteobacteria bacterium]|nr:hypothetical protein [Gammaproteobacteria bacterium]
MIQASRYLFIIISLLLIISCTTSGHRYIKIKPPVFGAMQIPEQVNSLLVESDFNRINFSQRVRDLNANATDALNKREGEELVTSSKLLRRYQHTINTELFVNVSIGRDKGDVELEFYEENNKELSEDSIKIYNQTKENLKAKLYDPNDFTES